MFDIVLAIGSLVLMVTFAAGGLLIVNGQELKSMKKRCTCGYSLRGLPPSVECCPECGTMREEINRELHRRGNRRSILGFICVSISFLLAILLIILGLFS